MGRPESLDELDWRHANGTLIWSVRHAYSSVGGGQMSPGKGPPPGTLGPGVWGHEELGDIREVGRARGYDLRWEEEMLRTKGERDVHDERPDDCNYPKLVKLRVVGRLSRKTDRLKRPGSVAYGIFRN